MFKGFILGLSSGGYCLASCIPVFVPYILSEDKNTKWNFICLCKFMLGRLLGYILFAILAWITGNFIIKLTKTIIFPGSLLTGFASIASMIVIWLGATLAFGRGWCSWTCFYGGLDEGCSSLCKKPRLKINRKWTYLSFAVLISIVLLSAATLAPVYCDWLCPFKAVTEFEQITSVVVLLKTIIFYSLFLILVMILPILTGKRTQCGLFCPFGAFQSLFNKINIFEIRIDKNKCLNCKKCVKECPTYSIDENSLSNGKALMTCTKCGKCIDACPVSAVSYHIKGTKIGVKTNLSRYLFLYPVYIFALTIGGGTIVKGIYRLLKLMTTGSFF